jgi:hypothetical protein
MVGLIVIQPTTWDMNGICYINGKIIAIDSMNTYNMDITSHDSDFMGL